MIREPTTLPLAWIYVRLRPARGRGGRNAAS